MERMALTIFFACLVTCASIVVSLIWIGEPQSAWPFQIAATTFVLGLANFLTWAVCFAYRLLQTIDTRQRAKHEL